jgi:parvulin-like peptidyl-prolyl isomerase
MLVANGTRAVDCTARLSARLFLSLLGLAGLSGLANAADDDKVVARRGTATLTMAEIDTRLDEIPADKRAVFMNSPERIQQTLSQLLVAEQAANDAQKEGLDKQPQFDALMALARKRILTQMKLERVRAAAVAKADLESLARERYLADSARFTQVETRSARHMLFDDKVRGDADARAAAEAALQRVRAGEDFGKVAAEVSDDTGTKVQGGLMNNIVRGQTDPAFEFALFSLPKSGDIAGPVKSQFGYHLIVLESITPERLRPFSEVRPVLLDEVTLAEGDRATREYTDHLQNEPIDADPDLVRSLRTRYGTVADPSAAAAAAETQR